MTHVLSPATTIEAEATMSLEQAAGLLRVPVAILRELLDSTHSDLPHTHGANGERTFLRSEVLEWLATA